VVSCITGLLPIINKLLLVGVIQHCCHQAPLIRNALRLARPAALAPEISTHSAIWLHAFLPKRTTDTADAPPRLRSSRFVCKVYHIATGSYFFRFPTRTYLTHSLSNLCSVWPFNHPTEHSPLLARNNDRSGRVA